MFSFKMAFEGLLVLSQILDEIHLALGTARAVQCQINEYIFSASLTSQAEYTNHTSTASSTQPQVLLIRA